MENGRNKEMKSIQCEQKAEYQLSNAEFVEVQLCQQQWGHCSKKRRHDMKNKMRCINFDDENNFKKSSKIIGTNTVTAFLVKRNDSRNGIILPPGSGRLRC